MGEEVGGGWGAGKDVYITTDHFLILIFDFPFFLLYIFSKWSRKEDGAPCKDVADFLEQIPHPHFVMVQHERVDHNYLSCALPL